MKKVSISPVTRIEGHGRVKIEIKNGEVNATYFSGLEFRGFEKFCEERLAWDMPSLTTRICGTCPVSHHLASIKAVEDLLKVEPPPVAVKLRELLHMGQFIHNSALHFFLFSSPDFIFGPDANPDSRNMFGLADAREEVLKKAVELRKIGQEIVEAVGGRAIHPVTAIPGGMTKPLTGGTRFDLIKKTKRAVELSKWAYSFATELMKANPELMDMDEQKTNYLGLNNGGELDLYNGNLKIIDPTGETLAEFLPQDYLNYIKERVEDDTYLKFPYYSPLGYPKGIYRVGPLARINVAVKVSTPLALREFKEFKKNGLVHKTMYYHQARLIELLYAAERAIALLEDDEIERKEVRVKVPRLTVALEGAGEKEYAGFGVVEAPRGTLIHHYIADRVGKIKKLNLIVATVQNNAPINLSVENVAEQYLKGDKIIEGGLNRVEMIIRAYDPCLSCSTHTIVKGDVG